MDLGGSWAARAADDELRRQFPEPSLDDSGWDTLDVPGHWRSNPSFAETDGPVVYRRRFDHGLPGSEQRAWLTLDGCFYQGDVWLDGTYVGDTEGYFFPHTFEVTDALRSRTEHVLAIELTCAPQHDRTAKRNLTGVFQHWDCLDPEWNPGGIWRPVHLDLTGAVRIESLTVRCTEATEEQAVVAFRAVLDTVDAREVAVRTVVGGTDHDARHPLATGTNTIEWTVAVDRPERWWPHALGEPVLHDVVVEVALPERDGFVSDRRRLRTGLRSVRLRSWIAEVNGERMFLKGANQGPTRMALAEASAEELARDVHLAVDAGLDLLRVHAHVSRPELYAAADEAGLLVWQDMPLQWGYARGVRPQAVRQARAAVELLGHHPSIAVWCGHNEPMPVDVTEPETTGDLVRLGMKLAAAQQLPTWNKTILDRSIKRAFEKADGTRPVVAHSGVLPHPPQLDGTDSHLYFGWYWGDERDFPGFLHAWPRLARFVSEFGAQAVPADAAFMEPGRWPDLDWERLGRRHSLQKKAFDRYVPPADHETFDEWRTATQRYQADVVRRHIEQLRRLKYRPTGGFCQFALADGHPGVTWSVLDHHRNAKLGFEALTEACRPVIVVADRPPATVQVGQRLTLAVHAVSDLRKPLVGARTTATVTTDHVVASRTWEGDLGADECAYIGDVVVDVGDRPGPLVIDLALAAEGVAATNRYETVVAADA